MSKTPPIYAHDPTRWRAGRFIFFGFIVIITTFGLGGYWAMATQIRGAVVAPAELRVESKSKPVQHSVGGLVGEILVKDGDTVEAGDVLIRFDQTTQGASLAIVETQLLGLRALRARLITERDDLPSVVFDDDLLQKAQTSSDVAKVVSDQQRLFRARLESYRQQRAQLGQRIGQLGNEIDGARSRLDSFTSQLASVEEELKVQQDLLKRGLTTRQRAQEFIREKARINGEQGALTAEIARLYRQIDETKIEITRLEEERREDSISQLREVQAEVSELQQRAIVARDDFSKIDLRAPQSGVVQELNVFSKGAVVAPGEAIMTIVPVADRLVLEARVAPDKRDQISIGQTARVRFSAFSTQTTPELTGEVVKISADRKVDETTGQPYFGIEVLLSDEERAKIGKENTLLPGLPAEVYIQTELRTPLSYLLKPLTDNMNRAFREE